jgi:hypothetical protein
MQVMFHDKTIIFSEKHQLEQRISELVKKE